MYVTLKVDFGHKGFSWDLIKTFTICPFVAFWGTNISQKMKQPGDLHLSAVDIPFVFCAPRAEHVANRRAWSVAWPGALKKDTWRIQGDPWLGMLTHLGADSKFLAPPKKWILGVGITMNCYG